MSVRGRFLGGGDIAAVPGEEETKEIVDDEGENRWVDDRLPGRNRGKDRFSSKEKVYGGRTAEPVTQRAMISEDSE